MADTAAIREQHVKHEMGQCVHFNGIQHDKCRAGVAYRELFGNEPGWAKHLCCLGDKESPTTCGSAHFPTREEAEKEVDEFEARMDRFSKALRAAKDDAKAHGLKKGSGGYGNVKCPNCEDGQIKYSVASYNGHMHAACSTPHCASWME